ncbi:FAD:protein FMN transferase [Paenibacillus oryzisoli]|uniref:FAD:protein FMN transferase n=1 Tax=Paenibacillus oryzisoli TaxID=1850517 RepID=UPI003D2B0BC6
MKTILDKQRHIPSPYEIRFRAMNTWIEFKFYAAESQAEEYIVLVKNWFETIEHRFTRFQADSELSYLNRLSGETCIVSDPMLEVLQLAELYRIKTNDTFNPFVLKALIRAGYSKSYEALPRNSLETNLIGESCQNPFFPLALNVRMKSVQLPSDTHLDLGGIVKSWAVKRIATFLHDKHCVERGLINAGGDLLAWSTEAEKQWMIGVEDPWNPEKELGYIACNELAVATSSTLGRRWENQHGVQHHLIDPRTMRPSESDIVQCTIIGKDPIECEIWSKTLCILGLEEGTKLFLERAPGNEALVFTKDRKSHFYGKQASMGTIWKSIDIDEYHYLI